MASKPRSLVRARQGHLDTCRERQGAQRASPPVILELWGGSADLAESNNTTIDGRALLRASRRTPRTSGPGDPYGRVLHFGIREHAMAAILNGIVLHGNTRPFGGTFLDLQRLRAARRSDLAAAHEGALDLRLDARPPWRSGRIVRPTSRSSSSRPCEPSQVWMWCVPADAAETAWAWKTILERRQGPAGIALTRQNIPVFERGDGEASGDTLASAKLTPRGGYILAEAPAARLDVIFIGDRLRGAARHRAPASRSRPTASTRASRRCRASSGSRSRTTPTASRCCRRRSGRASRSRPGIAPVLAPARSATTGAASRSSTSAHPPTTRPCSRSSASRPRPRSPQPRSR